MNTKLTVKTEAPAEYVVTSITSADDEILRQARDILTKRLMRETVAMGSPDAVKQYLVAQLAECEHEEFGVILLDARNCVIKDDRMFRGTLTQTSVYPREVVKTALLNNAAAVILYHNHPSGEVEPSRADEMLTMALRDALALIDVRTLDHVIVARTSTLSFAERGLI